MEISSENSKTMVKGRDESVHVNIRMNGEILEEVDKLKYIGATITKYCTSEADVRIRLATSTSALIRLTNIWKITQVGFKIKFSLYKTGARNIILWISLDDYRKYGEK